jgi:hypothetical protein
VGFRGKENKVAGTARNGPTATAAAAALTGCWGRNARLVPPSLIDTLRASSRKRKMSEAKFNKAVKIVQSLPKDGPIKPTQDDQLYVRTPVFFSSSVSQPKSLSRHTPTRSFTVTTSKVCAARRNHGSFRTSLAGSFRI